MVNRSELMQRRDKEQAKGVDRLEPKGNEAGTRAVYSRVVDVQRFRRMVRT